MTNIINLNNGKAVLEWRAASGNTVEIVDITVANICRREGWGRKLLEHLFKKLPDDITTVYAITRIENEIAQEFYEATNFRVVAVLRRFYNDTNHRGADAIMFGRSPRGPV